MVEAGRTAREWVDTVTELGLRLDGTVVVVGEQAGGVADALGSADGTPVVFDGVDFALTSRERPPDDLSTANAFATRLPNDSVELVVMRRPWNGMAEVPAVFAEAYRICRPGGGVVALELDLGRLADSPVARYPARLQFELAPGTLAHLTAATVSDADLSVELVRAGFRRIWSTSLDETFGSFSLNAYLQRARAGGWRGLAHLGDNERDRVIGQAADVLPSMAGDPITQREPWLAARGFKPG